MKQSSEEVLHVRPAYKGRIMYKDNDLIYETLCGEWVRWRELHYKPNCPECLKRIERKDT